MICRTIAVAAVLLCISGPAAAQSVTLEFENGRVNLSAANVPVSTILSEWSRLGGTEIVNGEDVVGAPVTLEFSDMPERQALDILLREASGYLLGPEQAASNGSSFDRLTILATSSAPQPSPAFQPGPVPPMDFPGVDPFDDPQGDVLFDDFDGAVDTPGMQRFRVPRDFVPPDGFDGQLMPIQPDPDGADDIPVAQPPPQGLPFGAPQTAPGAQGAPRPGMVVPVPQDQQQRMPQIGDEP